MVFDKQNGRVYVAGGEGYVGVFQEDDPDHYSELARIPSASSAKTAILVPSLGELILAVSPRRGQDQRGHPALRRRAAARLEN